MFFSFFIEKKVFSAQFASARTFLVRYVLISYNIYIDLLNKGLVTMNQTEVQGNIAKRILRFYIDGFRQMTVGRYLWALIILKLVILFFVFKLFFFPDRLARDYGTDSERAKAVRTGLLDRGDKSSDINYKHLQISHIAL